MRKFAARYSPASEARSGDAAKLSGYLAKTGAFDQAIGEFRLRGVTWRTGVECNRTLQTGDWPLPPVSMTALWRSYVSLGGDS
jgi:hypothetical protein